MIFLFNVIISIHHSNVLLLKKKKHHNKKPQLIKNAIIIIFSLNTIMVLIGSILSLE